jgi:hypothetical protein
VVNLTGSENVVEYSSARSGTAHHPSQKAVREGCVEL